jgi:hypothetical protein
VATFTPPTTTEVPPISIADCRDGPSTAQANPLGTRLFKYFKSRARGVAVFKMSDGTYQMSRQVPGVNVVSTEPYPATDTFPQTEPNGTFDIAQSWYNSQLTEYPAAQPQVAYVYYGGRSYSVSSAEAAALTAAGFGSYIT